MKLEEACLLIADCPHSTAPDEGSGFPLVRTPNIGRGRLVFEKMHRVSRQVYERRNFRAKPQEGDLIFAREAPAGNVALIARGQEVCLGQRTVLLRPNPRIVDPAYLTYYLLAPEQQHRLLSTAAGATVTHVNIPAIRGLEISLPPLAVQRRMGRMLSAYDDLIENNRKRIALLEESARQLYREWFVHFRFPGHGRTSFDHGVPNGWRAVKLGDVCESVREAAAPKQIAPETPYVGLEHMPRRSITLSEWGTAADVTSGKLRFREGEIIFGKIRPYFHKVGIALVAGVASSDSIIIRPATGELLPFVLLTVSSDAFVAATAQGMREGSKMPRADWKQMQQYPLAVPPSPVLAAFNRLLSPILAQCRTLALQSRALAAARDALLPRLMKGGAA